MERTNSFKFYGNFLDAINMLPENKRANACYEFCKYGITGELPKDESLAMFCVGVSVSVQKYQGSGGNHNPTGKNQWSKLDKSGQTGQTGQNEQTETKTETETKTRAKSIRPSLQEVIDYCKERNNSVDANRWYDFYTSNGWKVGKNPMKDWKAAIRTWEQKDKQTQQQEKDDGRLVWIEVGHFYIDDSENNSPGFSDLVVGLPQERRDSLWDWFMSKFKHQEIKLSLVRKILTKAREEL